MERKITRTVKQTVVSQTVKHTYSEVESYRVESHHSSQAMSFHESRNGVESVEHHGNGFLSHHETLKTIEPAKVSSSIGGFIVPHTKDKVTIYQALVTNHVSEEVALALLEAQAATGGIIQLSNNQKLPIEVAVQEGVVGPEYQQKLIIASSAALGYKDKEETLTLYKAFKKGLVSKNDTVRYLEAQVATGGIIDHVNGNRISISEALKLNYIDEHLLKALTESSDLSKCYINPNTQDYSTYQELLSKCSIDVDTGLLLFPLQETLQGLRKPVTAEQLLKANIINQVQYDEVSQGKQTIQSLGGLSEVHQYLQGQAIIGEVYIESTKEKMSVYQAMKKNFLPQDTAVALLEAQAASGFIIDPVRNRRLTVTEAIQEEVIGLELKEKLLTAERAVTGFNDPYTGNKISLFQALMKELIDKKLGVNLLEVQIATGGIVDPVHSFHIPLEVAFQRGLLDKEMAKIIFATTNDFSGFLDPNTNDLVTYQELQKRCVINPDSNTYIFPVKLTFNGLRGKVTSDELLDSLIIDKTTYEDLQQGKISVQDVAEWENVRQYLQGTGCVAGVAIVSTNERKNIYQAMKEHLLMPGTSIALLEAQAATGYLVDPIKNLKFSVEDAVKNGLIGTEVYEKLISAEKAAVGYKDPSSGENLSLFQAMKQGFVMQNHGRHLLEAQLATGGIIDPSKKHRVPAEVAYRRGIFNKEMNKSLLDPTDNKGFFDPNTKQNMTYGQLLERCLVDCHTGLYLIPVFDNTHDAQKTPHSFIDYQIKKTLDGIKLTATSGKFKGRVVTMWQLLFSEYFTTEFRESLFKEYTSGNISLEDLSSKVDAAIRDLVSTTKVTFEGLRESVTPGQLLESEIIDKDLFKKLQQGEASAKDVVNIDTVKKYLQGTGSIGGLILTDTQEKISIYQAKRKGFLRPGTSLILLEAQAATGFIIDPVKNKKYSVDEALKANIIGPEFYEKLLSAEKSVTGYKDPYTETIISLFQAMSKDLIVKDHGIRLLEAQIATGGIIDPINSHRIPVEVAYKRGYFDKKMNVILSDPSDDTKGFFDPNTNENLTYLQLKERCITDPSTSLCLLPLYSRKRQLYINDYIKDSFRNLDINVRYGRFKGQTISAWVLINSEYFSEWRRREILEQFRLRKLTVEQVTILIEEEIKKWTEICVPTLRGQVNFYNLLEYEIIDKDQFEQVLEGKLTTDDVFKMENVQNYLQGSGVLGGVLIEPSNQRISFYEATKKNILQPSTVLPLLEAQAATGNIIDPVSNQRLSVDEALKAEVINPHIYNKLLSAQEAVTGYRDPFSGKKISLFQAMKKGLVEEKHAKQLLEVQLATGGIIDPIHSFHVPSSVAKKLGYINEEVYESLAHPTEDSKSFYDPHAKENVTYSDLLSRSQKDESTGVYLFPLPQDFAEVPAQNISTDEEVQQVLRNTRIEERNTTIWELIHSGYFTEEQRFEILEKYKSKKVSMEDLITEILQIVKNNEIKKTTHICFQGLRGKVPVVWLLDLEIITKKTFDELVQGIKSIEEVSEFDYVKKCLQGTGSITGAFLPSTKEKMSIYQAMKKNLIMPAYGVMLLEAQAATGFIIDPVKNEKHTVDSAVKSGVVGPELHEKLLIAESAVTGYTDPYTGNKISLGEAINKELIPQKEGLPLLQAQLATGGIVDPLYCHYVPLQVAGKMGFVDEKITNETDTLKIYFDPSTKEKLNYQQLKERCYTDTETGSLLLPVSENAAFYAEEHFIDVLKSVMVSVNAGRFKGQTVSVWELLNSEYVSIDKLKELLLRYKNSSSEFIQEIIKTVTSIIEETNASSTKIKFKGLRKQVSASDLFQSDVIDKRTLDELNLGKKTIVEVTEMDNVKRYLEGTNCIAGILLQSTNTKMTIYEAMLKRILRPGMALVLLEAQAATGFIVDPVKNRKLSVDEAFAEGLIGMDIHAKLLSAEQAVTGYTDPYTESKISLFQAMQKNLIVDCHGIRLLEAQIATGGIIDPVHSHRVPVEVAYKRGYFDEAMNKSLSDPSDDTKGFFDPNTHENLTYLQLVERCIQDPETGLYLLQVVRKGENYFYITDQMKSDLISRHIRLQVGKFANQTVTIWEILCSHYFTELKKRKLVKQYTEGVLSIEQLISSVLTIIEEYEAKSSILKFQGIRSEVSATELYNTDIIDKKTMDDLKEGRQTIEAISQQENVKRYLKGSGCITGVLVLPNNETISIFEAMKKGILSRDIGLSLLEAQISAGVLVDPSNNQAFSISKALSAGLISEEEYQQLEIAEKAFSGFTDLESSRKISLFQAIKKGIISKDQGIPLLDSQLATGGIVDPNYNHRLPLHVAYRKGYLDEDFYILISDSVNGRKGFVDPNTHERITYKDLLERCVKDPKTGMYMVQVAEKRDDYFYIDEPTKNILLSTPVKMNEGKFKGQDISLWDLLSSSYISEEKRKYLIKKYKSNTSTTIKEIISIILSIIEDQEKSQNDIWFQGLRKQVTAVELFDAGILSKETLDGLQQETKTVVEVAKTELVRRYLEGTSCIAGILIPSKHDPTKKEKLNIYDAMLRRLLRPGTALILLEAQAATGFVIDCVQNKKLSVDEALLAGLIGHEIYEKLLCAEKGVTGYTNPYTGDKISLFQAMEKNLIVKEHGIRLLEAQIATGGIIDPVHSHRVPVEVAYKRGYFNEELNQILSDPTDDTKGFFDPNTQQNLTYLQLLQRCTQDTDTGLYVLELKSSRFSLSHIQTSLQSKMIQVTSGEFEGKRVSIWELLNSKHISKEKREELLRKYESGTLTIENIMTTVIKIMTEEKINVSHVDSTHLSDQHAQLQERLQAEVVEVSVGDFTGQSRSLWELLHSRYFSEDKRIEILQRLKYGTLTIQETITHVIKVITEAESINTNAYHTVEESSVQEDEIQRALQSINICVKKGQYIGQTVPVWDLLNSSYIPDETQRELLEYYKLTVQDIMEMVIQSIKENDQALMLQYNLKEEVYNTLQTVKMDVNEGEFKGQTHTLWDLLNSKYFSMEKKQEFLDQFNSGVVSVDKLIKMIITIISETEERSKKLKFKGLRRQVTATELLVSEIIDQNILTELTQGKKTVEEVTQIDSVKRYLEGTSCMAGVLVPSLKDPSKKDKMTIYNAMLRNILRPGTALILLEAQAATGFIIDPINNKKLSVDEAIGVGIIGSELHKKLLSAEKAVTGYIDPYTGDKISLFQAMQKDLIVKDHGIRLLEAQIATGGIIDPVHSHRVPVEVAYKRGYFDKEMNQVLSDPTDDTKGFFDPNTQENLTYMQLLSRCIQDPDTGLYMLEMKVKKALPTSKALEASLKSQNIQVKSGRFKGQSISIWVLLYSEYFTEEQRQMLLKQYKSGTITIEELITTIVNTIEKWELKTTGQVMNGSSAMQIKQEESHIKSELVEETTVKFQEQKVSETKEKIMTSDELDVVLSLPNTVVKTFTDEDLHKTLNIFTIHVTKEEFQSRRVTLWEIIHSKYITEEQRNTQLNKYQISLEKVNQTIIKLIEGSETKSDKDIQQELEDKLALVTAGEFKGQNLSLWFLLHSKYLTEEKREKLLKKYKSGTLSIDELITVLIKIVQEAEETSFTDTNIQTLLQSQTLDMSVADFKGQNVSVWELLNSHYVSDDKRKAIMEKLQSGSLSVQEAITMLITIITETEDLNTLTVHQDLRAEQPTESYPSIQKGGIQKALQSINIDVKKGQYARQRMSVWDLIHSKYIPESKRQELLGNYIFTIENIIQIVAKSIEEVKQKINKSTLTEYNLKAETFNTLQMIQTEVTLGELKGQKHSLWDLLNTKYFSEEKKIELLQKADSGVISINELTKIITTLIEETEERSKNLKFKGLRRQVTATELLVSEIIDHDTLSEMAQGRKTVEEVTQMDNVKRYLEGTSCIAGVLVPSLKDPSKKDKMSIYNAMLRNILRPGTALVLLEAQAATGFVIDPVNNQKLSVDEAAGVGIIGSELHTKLLSAERAVTGYTDPYTGSKISLFQAMQKDLIVKDHGIRLLEAQIATGGIIDPVHSHRVPVEVAYKRGYFDKEMNQVLSDPTDDTKGFFDPNTHENLTYLQLLSRCIQDPDTGLSMLEMKVKKALPTGKALEASLKSQNIQVKSGRFKGQSISIWVLLHSEYFTEEKTQILLKQYKSGTITTEELITTIVMTVEEWEQKTSQVMNGSSTMHLEQKEKLESRLKSELVEVIKGKFQEQKISVWELLHSDYITENKRKEILQNYSSGVWNLEQIIRIITAIITETEENFISIEKTENDGTFSTPQLHENISSTDDDLCKALNAIIINFTTGEFQEQNPSLWKVLHSKYLSEEKRKEQLNKHQVTVEKMKLTILQLIEDFEPKSEEEIQKNMELKFAEINSGEFKGQHLSVWFLLHSKYITEEKRQELIEKYMSGALTMEELLKTIITIIEETEKSHSLKFKGFRRQVTATELLKSEIIDQNTLNELTQGSKTVEEVTQMDNVKRYLEGTSCIAGVFVTSKKDPTQREKMTIFDAMLRHILRPGTALVLLEAQAATGYVIDPIQNKKLSVDEAFSAGLIGYEIYDKLLSAERGVTGYKDPYTGGKISLFQAMKKDLIVKDHGIRLLEAQIATGGIIDPIHSHRVPVEVAYKRGYFDEEMNQILSDPTDDTKGFFDPNTHENLTYLQLLQRCVNDQETGLYMLDVKGGKLSIQVEQTNNSVLKSRTIRVDVSVFKGKEISVWDLLYSQYISVEKREELLKRYHAGTLAIEELITMVTAIIAETDKTSVSSTEESSVKQQLRSVTVEIFKGSLQEESISLWDLLHSNYIAEDKRKELLEKFKSRTLTIEEIINIVLSIIHRTEHTSSKTEVIVKEEVKVTSVPVTVDHWPSEEQLQNALEVIPSDLSEKTSRQENVSVWDLLNSENVPQDKKKELLQTFTYSVRGVIRTCSSILKESSKEASDVITMNEEQRKTLQSTMTQISEGHFRGQTLSVWDLLYSNYITPEKREDILLLYSAGKLTTENIIKMVITVIEETEERAKHLQFRGLRKQVSAMELLSSEIIDQRTLNELTQGSKTLEEVTKMDNVKRYLEGTGCIAGVFVPSKKDPAKKEKMSIYQAMWKQLLRPGTALVLLEAQAATGFIIDPINNKKLSVDDAVSAGVVGKELHAKLLSAERAVTGYNDPYTSGKISLFQAMKKNLIVKDHGIRLLEAQIATGGIIDPVHSHRVPVEVAYKRGYFDEEINEILSDPSDDTKGFFDPNTHANLTYLQLLQSCVQDPDTGLCMLEVKDSKSPLYQLDQAKQNILQKQMVEIKIEEYQGQKFSLWELLSSNHFVEIEKERRGLLAKYKAGTITLENLTTNTVSLIEQMEMKRSTDALERSTTSSSVSEREVKQAKQRVQTQNFLQSVDISVKGHKSSLWELLNSSYISSEKKNELLVGYESGELSLENLTKCITEIFMSAEKASPEMYIPRTVTISPEKTDTECPKAIQNSLQVFTLDNCNEFTGQNNSLWDMLHSKAITPGRRWELLRKYYTTVKTIITTLTDLVQKKVPTDHSDTATSLKSIEVPAIIGELIIKGKTHSLWDLLHSKYVTEDKRRELLEKYESKSISWEEMLKMITTLIEETEEKGRNIKFNGLRKQVSASELLKSEIIDQDTLLELAHGTITLQEVTQMNTVKRYLEGTNCIAGVLVQSKTHPTKKEKMSIYDAMLKRILRPGTALVLLEAQAATGFIIDPIKNIKLTVDEAVAARIFGKELHSKLLSAERAVTGYNDPTTNQKISLFQAMQKDLIVKDHGIRLLEAQIATGGIIDPVHSHRVPVEVAYRRGYFDEEVNQILSDPSDDTKGFFDPNTHENLTYLQLLQRAVQDPDTGLLMLEVTKK